MIQPNAQVKAGGAAVLDWNQNYAATGETIPEGTKVQTGMMFTGSFDEQGQPVGEQFTYYEVFTEDGTEAWVNAKDLEEVVAA